MIGLLFNEGNREASLVKYYNCPLCSDGATSIQAATQRDSSRCLSVAPKLFHEMGYFRSFSVSRPHNFAADKNLRNMKKNSSVNFRADWFEAIEAFPEDRQLEAYRAIMRYAFYGEIPSDPSIKMAIGLIMHLIDKRRATRHPKETAAPAKNADAAAKNVNSPARLSKCADAPSPKAATNFDRALICRDSGGWSASESFQRVRLPDADGSLSNKPEPSG